MLLTYFKVLCIIANLGLLSLLAVEIFTYVRGERHDQQVKVIALGLALALAVVAPFI